MADLRFSDVEHGRFTVFCDRTLPTYGFSVIELGPIYGFRGTSMADVRVFGGRKSVLLTWMAPTRLHLRGKLFPYIIWRHLSETQHEITIVLA